MVAKSFLLINFIVLLLNAGVGIYINLGSLLLRSSTSKDRFTLHGATRRASSSTNESFMESELFPAENIAKEYGVLDNSGNFTWHPFIWPAKNWVDTTSSSQVCLASQTSVDRLFWLSWQAEAWSGPISVAVFAPGSDLGVAVAMINYLRKCFPGILERTSLHLTYPSNKPSYIADRQDDYSQLDCSSPESVNKNLLRLRDAEQSPEYKYPQNLLRNIARKTCGTGYSLTVDVDMLVVPYMADSLEGFLSTKPSPCSKCAFVVPAYEIHKNVQYPPDNKQILLDLMKKKLARRFHVKVYDKNQGNTQLDRWEVNPGDTNSSDTSSSSDDVPEYHIMYNITTYEEFWEPLLILPNSAPGFDERFIGYGFTRSSQVYELKLRNFTFSVLDKAFLCHRGFQTTMNYPMYRKVQIQYNRKRYQAFKRELHARLNRAPPKPLPQPEDIKLLPSHHRHSKGSVHLVNNNRRSIISIRKIPAVFRNLQDT